MNAMVEAVAAAQARMDAHEVLEAKVAQAQLVVIATQHCPPTARTALQVCELLNVLLAADALYCELLGMACRLEYARVRGNMVDFWRAVTEIGSFARERET